MALGCWQPRKESDPKRPSRLGLQRHRSHRFRARAADQSPLAGGVTQIVTKNNRLTLSRPSALEIWDCILCARSRGKSAKKHQREYEALHCFAPRHGRELTRKAIAQLEAAGLLVQTRARPM
jgi:hypothetical protein